MILGNLTGKDAWSVISLIGDYHFLWLKLELRESGQKMEPLKYSLWIMGSIILNLKALLTGNVRGWAMAYHGQVVNLASMGAENEI